jgi:NitT/TauT family transport system permease protein
VRSLRAGVRRAVTGAVGIALAIGAWWLAAEIVPSGIVPGPVAVIVRFTQLMGSGLALHAGASLARIGMALALSLATAVPVGICMGRSTRWDRLFSPLVYLLFPVPKIALLPIVMLLLGIGNSARVAIVTLVLFFQLLVSTRDAARAVPEPLLLSLRSLGAGRGQALRWVILPWLLPSLLSALRVGTATALAVLFFSETFGTRTGLGYFVMESWMRLSYVDMVAGILGLSLLGLTLFAAIDAVERRACRGWNPPTSRG